MTRSCITVDKLDALVQTLGRGKSHSMIVPAMPVGRAAEMPIRDASVSIRLSIYSRANDGLRALTGLQGRCLPTPQTRWTRRDGRRSLAKVRVAGSNPVVRSRFTDHLW